MIITPNQALIGSLSMTVVLLLFSIFRNLSARAVLAESQRELARIFAEKQTLESSLQEAQGQLSELRAQLGLAQGEIKGLQERVDELRDRAQEGELSQQKLVRITAQMEMAQANLSTREEQLTSLSAQEKALQTELQQLKANNASLRTDHDNMERRATEQRQWVADQTQAFEDRIRVLTNSLLKKQSEETQQQSRKSLDEMLTPFKTTLGEFKVQVEGFAREQLKEREGLAAQIKTLADVHGNLATQTDSLTKALTHQNKQAGDWGE
ncbi:MAG: DNA recombination protein RmuC, partial [Oceanococcus sp.]